MMPVTKKRHDEHGRGIEGLNHLLEPRNVPGFVDACRLATEANDLLFKAMALLNLEPRENLDRIQGMLKVLKALKNTDLVER